MYKKINSNFAYNLYLRHYADQTVMEKITNDIFIKCKRKERGGRKNLQKDMKEIF